MLCISAKQILNIHSCPSPPLPSSERHTCTPSLAETPVHTASPIYHRFCRVTLVFISQPPFFALLSCEQCSCGCFIKIRLEEVIRLPRTKMLAAGDRWLGQCDRCDSAAGVSQVSVLAWICQQPPRETHLICSSLQLTALVVLLVFFFVLPVPLLPPSAELSLWLHWPAVILIPTLRVTGRACEL